MIASALQVHNFVPFEIQNNASFESYVKEIKLGTNGFSGSTQLRKEPTNFDALSCIRHQNNVKTSKMMYRDNSPVMQLCIRISNWFRPQIRAYSWFLQPNKFECRKDIQIKCNLRHVLKLTPCTRPKTVIVTASIEGKIIMEF